uniref:ABC-type Fe3+-hydroxamate transport system, periplasmic component n=1 Tax=Candidatus Actinomarina minuta TaxID=1389454 RepID=S5DPL0_9ACTN|nr:ABC-type Fe3+-hydroxamate transport system, periplasmic component [Candidatus Actinomarina minuta]
MKTKLIFLALLVSMCSSPAQESEDIKIISLSTTHTEIIQSLEAQDTLVAVDAFSEVDFPVEKIDAYTVTAEELAPLNPDMVIIAFDFNGIVEGLESQEINYVLLPPAKNFEDVYSQISIIGEIVNKKGEAYSKVRDMKLEINRILDDANYEDVSVYHEIGYSYGIYSVNSDSLIGEIYNALGVVNIANSEEDPFGSGYPALSEEMVIQSNPDYIVVGHSDYLNKDLSIREGWGNISAVESSNVYFLDDTLASNWGTTTVQLVEELSNTFEESAQTNVYSDQLLLISLLFLVIMIYVLTRRNTKQKV